MASCTRRYGWLAAAVIGIGGAWPAALAAQAPQRLVVFGAVSLRDVFSELGRVIEQRQPGLRVTFNFAASNELALQIQNGAEADVFASADEHWMEFVRDSARAVDSTWTFARNRLAVIVPRTNPGRIDRLQDLARGGVKVVLAADAVPAGAYSRDVLRNLSAAPGFAPDFGRRVQANVVSREPNVRAVVAKVQLGEADAGLVYVSDVTPAVARFVRLLEIPEAYNVLATYPVAALRGATNPNAARAFIALLLSPEGQAALERQHFVAVATPQPAARP